MRLCCLYVGFAQRHRQGCIRDCKLGRSKLGFCIVTRVHTNPCQLVASQSLISATFSLFQQVINMKSFLPLQMICTSDVFQGQVYIPAVNWVLMTLTIIMVAAFGDSQNLTNAFGFSVATVMFSTSILLAVSMYYVKCWHWTVSVIFVIFFGFFDGNVPFWNCVAHQC